MVVSFGSSRNAPSRDEPKQRLRRRLAKWISRLEALRDDLKVTPAKKALTQNYKLHKTSTITVRDIRFDHDTIKVGVKVILSEILRVLKKG